MSRGERRSQGGLLFRLLALWDHDGRGCRGGAEVDTAGVTAGTATGAAMGGQFDSCGTFSSFGATCSAAALAGSSGTTRSSQMRGPNLIPSGVSNRKVPRNLPTSFGM
jgi:hypothetical protein